MRQATLGTRQVTLYNRPNSWSGPIDLAGARELEELLGPPETVWPAGYDYGEGYRERYRGGYGEGYSEPEPELEPTRRDGKYRGTHRRGRGNGHSTGQGGQRAAERGGQRATGQGGRGATGLGGQRRADTGGFRRAGVAALAVTGVLAGGGIVGTAFLSTTNGQPVLTGADTLHATAVATVAGGASANGTGSAIAGGPGAPDPQNAFMPRTSAKPRHAKPSSGTSASPTASATPTHTPKHAAAPTPTHTATHAPTPSPTPTPPTTGGGASACNNPVFTTSTDYGTYTDLPYFVANDMWNIGSSNASQTLSVCSHSEWSVTANVSGGGNSVKTYPNGQRDFDTPPAISSLKSVTSTFAESSPGSGTYETAYDIWLNGVANPAAGSDEVMIWTQNHGQIPGGSPQASVTFDGRTYTVWKGNGNYFAFVADQAFTSGDLNLLEFFQYLINKGWVPANSTLAQVDYGVEIVATNGPETFNFSNFSVSTS